MLFSLKNRFYGLIYLSLVIVIFRSCKSEDAEIVTENIFQLNTENNSLATDSENWFIIHDIDGNVLDYKKVLPGKTYQFNSTLVIKEDKISVTHLQYLKTLNGSKIRNNYWIKTYQDIKVFDQWTLKKIENNPPQLIEPAKKAYLTITNTSNSYPYRIELYNSQGSASNDLTYVNGAYKATIKFNENEGILIKYFENEFKYKYKYLSNLANEQIIEVDANLFESPYILLSPEINGGVQYFSVVKGLSNTSEIVDVYNNSQGYILNSSWGSQFEKCYAPYIKEITNYSSQVDLAYTDKSIKFQKVGEPLTSIAKPIENFIIVNNEIDSYQFTNSGNCIFYQTQYSYEDITANSESVLIWEVTNKELNKRTKVTNLPVEIIDSHPSLKATINKLKHSFSYHTIKSSMSYDEQISALYKGLKRKPQDEVILIVR